MVEMNLNVMKDPEVKKTRNRGGMAIGINEEWNRIRSHIKRNNGL